MAKPTTPTPQLESMNQAADARWIRLSGVTAATFFLLVSASFLQSDQDDTDIIANFTASESIPAQPVTRSLPTMDFSVDGQMLQLGLYRSLDGAESQQRAIAALGLTADIEKRSNEGNTLYAVLIGPLSNDEYRAAVSTLNTHDLNFFHRKEGS